MNTHTRVYAVIFILCVALAFSCARQNVDQLTEAKKTAEGASKAVSGDVIKTAENAGKPEEKPAEEPAVPPSKEGGENGERPPFPLPGPSPRVPPVTPIEGKITIEALVYPMYNPATGKYEKPKIGGVPAFTTMTPDSVPTVVGYYNQLLDGRKYEVRQNIGENPGPLFGEFSVDDNGAHWGISIRQEIPSAPTSITIMKR